MWNKGFKGNGVCVAILDTGCDYTHKDLKGKVVGGYNFTSDYDGDPKNYMDNNGHGTHVAGIIGARGKTVQGIAPKAELFILKVLDKNGKGSRENIIKAINYCIKWNKEDNFTKINVINLSLSGNKDDVELYNVINEATLNDIVIVCASGNNGDGSLSTEEECYPSVYDS